jgi:hypothetical protein
LNEAGRYWPQPAWALGTPRVAKASAHNTRRIRVFVDFIIFSNAGMPACPAYNANPHPRTMEEGKFEGEER